MTEECIITKSSYGETLTRLYLALNMLKTVESVLPTEGRGEILSHMSGMWPAIVGQQNYTITKQDPSLILKDMLQIFQYFTVRAALRVLFLGVKSNNMPSFQSQKNVHMILCVEMFLSNFCRVGKVVCFHVFIKRIIEWVSQLKEYSMVLNIISTSFTRVSVSPYKLF